MSKKTSSSTILSPQKPNSANEFSEDIRMKRLLYNLTLHCFVAPVLLTYYAPQVFFKGKYRKSISGKLGNLSSEIARNPLEGLRVWFHAVSVGEVVALAPLVEKLSKMRPDLDIVISTGTETGQQRAQELISCTQKFFYMPLDFPFAVKKAIKKVSPDIFVMTETEIWPNLIYELKRSGAKIALVNGRISDRSFPRYLTVKRFLRDTLDSIDLYSMCSEEDASRISQMGANPNKIRVSGNIKIDSAFKPPEQGVTESLMRLFEVGASNKVIVAGSIHPGEDEIVVSSYKHLLKTNPDLILVIAPRHLDKIKLFLNTIQKAGLTAPVMTSELKSGTPRNGRQIILIDEMGELFKAYSIADIVFVGGSLVPRGGQNILEPASWSKPIIFGPYMEDFRDSSETLLKNRAAFQVSDGQELTWKLDLLLKDPDLGRTMGQAARKRLEIHAGSADKTTELLLGLVDQEISPQKNRHLLCPL